jgi:predicted phosphodiesterase
MGKTAKEYLYDEQVKYQNSINLDKLKGEAFLLQVEEMASRVFGNIVVSDTLKRRTAPSSRKVFLALSDLHFRALLNNFDHPYQYGPEEEARALSYVTQETIDFAKENKDRKDLTVLVLGDVIENVLHDARTGAPLAEQACAAIYLLSSMVGILAAHFNNVDVICVTGNHGRIKSRHPGRAFDQKWDSIETIIYYGLKSAVNTLKNVDVNIEVKQYAEFSVLGERGFATHGDGVVEPGTPSRTINVAKLEHLTSKVGHELNGKPYGVVVVGHVHTASVSQLGNGTTLIINGSTMPVSPYGISKGFWGDTQAQVMWEATSENPVNQVKFIRINEKVYSDRQLRLIAPFEGLND